MRANKAYEVTPHPSTSDLGLATSDFDSTDDDNYYEDITHFN